MTKTETTFKTQLAEIQPKIKEVFHELGSYMNESCEHDVEYFGVFHYKNAEKTRQLIQDLTFLLLSQQEYIEMLEAKENDKD